MMPRKPIMLFILIAFGFTWANAFWITYLLSAGAISPTQEQIGHSIGALGPALGAIIAIYTCYGKQGLRAFSQQLFRIKPIPFRSLPVVFSPFIFFLLGLLIYRISKGHWFDFSLFLGTNWNSALATFIWLLPLFSYAILEEIGWRGFLLPHLQDKHNAWRATLLLTGIWGLWHIPFFLYRFEFSIFISIGFFFGLWVGALILTYLYNSSKGALLPVVLFHLFMNICSGFDKEIIVAVMSTGYIFIAVYLFKTFGKAHLSSEIRTSNYFNK